MLLDVHIAMSGSIKFNSGNFCDEKRDRPQKKFKDCEMQQWVY